MYYNKVELCGVNTSKLKTLTAEEKNELLRKSKNGLKRSQTTLTTTLFSKETSS